MALIETYKALADDSRLRLIHALNHSSFSVQELTGILNLSQSTVSHHLKILTQAGIIESQKSGTFVYYRLAEPQTENNSKAGPIVSEHFLSLISAEKNQDGLNLLNGLGGLFANDKILIEKILEDKRNELKSFFDSAANEWKSVRPKLIGNESYFSEITKLIHRDQTVLELGCGAGAFLDAILPRPGVTIAVDYSESMLNAAKKNLSSKASGADLRLGYLEHLPVANNSVDVAVSYMVLPFIRDPKQVLSDVYRVLNEEGKFILIDSSPADPSQKQTDPSCLPTDNLPRTSLTYLMRWLQTIGFKTVTSKSVSNDVFLIVATK